MTTRQGDCEKSEYLDAYVAGVTGRAKMRRADVDKPFESRVKAYKTEADFHKEAPGMESAGWRIEVVEEKPWQGEFARMLPDVISDRFFPPRPHTVVTYIRGKL